MMTIIDIVIYVAFAFFASSLARKSEDYIKENDISSSQWDKYLTYFVLFFAIIGGLRWNVGVDSAIYAALFDNREIDFSHEKLWAYILFFFQENGIHWILGLAFCAFIQIFFIVKAIQPYRWLIVFIPFLFFGGTYWMYCMNAVRQMMAACCLLWASRFIYDRKPVYYLITILVCSQIHQSALILLPLYLIPSKLDLTNKKWFLISTLLCCVVLGQIAGLGGLAGYIQAIAEAADYNRYGEGMAEMLRSGYNDEALSFGPMMLSYLLIPIFIIWYGDELKEKYGKKVPYFCLWYSLAFIYSCVYFLVCNLGHIFIRPTMYLSLFQMVMGAMLLRYLWTEYVRTGIRQLATIAFCCIVAVNTTWDVYKASGRFFESVTYKISFFHKDQQKWFGL